ncbi:hypothetical protein [Halorussus lipolyticus]|uniref:hypothetical protein n=1 Tax=Halorussus lipolyticus TaxID=3034024 RepID=UPI0023E86C45|nr:hypothetical protein [Halorussus sp. DT80]
MSGRERPITGSLAGESSARSVRGVVVTGGSIVGVFVVLGVVATVVYDAVPVGVRLPALVVGLAVLGVGGLYAVLRIRDRFG